MAKNKPWKIGFGTGAILLGLYLIFKYQQDLLSVIFGFIAIAFGVGLIASN